MTLYPCCVHCDHDDSGRAPDQHARPCPEGCNHDEEEAR